VTAGAAPLKGPGSLPARLLDRVKVEGSLRAPDSSEEFVRRAPESRRARRDRAGPGLHRSAFEIRSRRLGDGFGELRGSRLRFRISFRPWSA
jgi:hypothetical protein